MRIEARLLLDDHAADAGSGQTQGDGQTDRAGAADGDGCALL
jgi:hypothetical protein